MNHSFKPSSPPLVYSKIGRRAAERQVALILELRKPRPDLKRFAADFGCPLTTIFSHVHVCGWRTMYVSSEERALLLARREVAPEPLAPYVADRRRMGAGKCPENVSALFAAVAAHYGLRVEQLVTIRHDRKLTEPRMAALVLAVETCGVRPDHCAIWLGRHRKCSAYYLRTYRNLHDTERAFRARMAALRAAVLPRSDAAAAA